jgi:hypothetical protein
MDTRKIVVRELKEYPKLYEAAMKNVESFNKKHKESRTENSYLDFAFNWQQTPEGAGFWYQVAIGNIDVAKKRKPHLF